VAYTLHYAHEASAIPYGYPVCATGPDCKATLVTRLRFLVDCPECLAFLARVDNHCATWRINGPRPSRFSARLARERMAKPDYTLEMVEQDGRWSIATRWVDPRAWYVPVLDVGPAE
jgi:hypothetical protein